MKVRNKKHHFIKDQNLREMLQVIKEMLLETTLVIGIFLLAAALLGMSINLFIILLQIGG